MKKAKVLGIILGVFVVFFILVAVVGSRYSNKDKEIANKVIQNDISMSGDISMYKNMSKEELEENCLEKHIEITSSVLKMTTLYVVVGDSAFSMKCYVDNIPQDLSENDEVTLNGACTYVSDKYLRLRVCEITNISKQEIPVKEDTTTEQESEADTDTDSKSVNDTSSKKENNKDIQKQQTNQAELADSNTKDVERSENEILEDVKDVLSDSLGNNSIKSVEMNSGGVIEIDIYFERKSTTMSTNKLKESVLDTAYTTLKDYYEYMQSYDDAPVRVIVVAYFPDDGKKNADEACYQVVCRKSDLEKFDFTSSENSQMEEYAYACKWLITII